MWTKFSALPNFAKIGIACLLVLVIYLSSRHQPQPPYHDGSAPPSINSASREAPSNTDARDELLARDKAELDELMPKITGCMAEIKRADDQMISDSMNQAALDPNSNRPECEQNLNEWMAEGLSLEAALKRANWRLSLIVGADRRHSERWAEHGWRRNQLPAIDRRRRA